MKVFREIIAS